jgi:hypothetical protein
VADSADALYGNAGYTPKVVAPEVIASREWLALLTPHANITSAIELFVGRRVAAK